MLERHFTVFFILFVRVGVPPIKIAIYIIRSKFDRLGVGRERDLCVSYYIITYLFIYVYIYI